MTSATIKLFLPHGDAKRLRVGEVSNWTGKALAAPRTELDDLLFREEAESAGIYFLFGSDPESGDALAYVGEAEVIRDRLRQHKAKDFWNAVVVFVSKDENLTKAHIRYLENRLLQEAKKAGRYRLENANTSNPKLPESDREDMEVFLSRIRQVLPVLGSDLLTPISGSVKMPSRRGNFSARTRVPLLGVGGRKVGSSSSKIRQRLPPSGHLLKHSTHLSLRSARSWPKTAHLWNRTASLCSRKMPNSTAPVPRLPSSMVAEPTALPPGRTRVARRSRNSRRISRQKDLTGGEHGFR